MKKQYAVDKLVKGIWQPISQTNLTIRKAEKMIGEIIKDGSTARLMSWTQAKGYQEVYNIRGHCGKS